MLKSAIWTKGHPLITSTMWGRGEHVVGTRFTRQLGLSKFLGEPAPRQDFQTPQYYGILTVFGSRVPTKETARIVDTSADFLSGCPRKDSQDRRYQGGFAFGDVQKRPPES